MLACGIVVVVVDKRLGGLLAAQVMQIPGEVDPIDPHVQLHVSLGRGAQELLAMVFGPGNGRVQVVRGIEDAVGSARTSP